ncbi:MAG: hypothetical protein WAN71_19920 [Mycobacterium sp.]|uniref:hypothetical protein n=1 Tax=Mycobacterium sp. TaxID=1785 RepID=UPI003BAE260C
MNAIRVKRVSEFNGDDVVLLAMDHAGLGTFLAALTQAEQQGSSQLQCRGRIHDFVIESGAADIELDDDRAVWRLDHTKAVEIIEKLKVLSSSGHPCHHYVDDMLSPAPTLVLSRDEYISPSWLTAGKEPIFGDDSE